MAHIRKYSTEPAAAVVVSLTKTGGGLMLVAAGSGVYSVRRARARS